MTQTRLDVVIRRLLAQRACIDAAVALLRWVPGPALEIGLGSGRTYDHLRARFPDREIFAFDRELASHPKARPDAAHFIHGDFRETLPTALARIGSPAALAHCDIGSYDPEASQRLAASMAPLLPPLIAKDAIVLSDQPIPHSAWRELPLPGGLDAGCYFIYRVC